MKNIILAIILMVFSFNPPKKIDHSYNIDSFDISRLAPPNHQVYDYIKIYSKQYNVPFEYALKCAKAETGYRGISHWKYNPFQTSVAKAYGPLQVQVPTAKDMDSSATKNKVLYDIRFNVEIGLKYQHWLYNKYLPKKHRKWIYVYSAYNKGLVNYENINNYAVQITKD